jgi:hypothetical protein
MHIDIGAPKNKEKKRRRYSRFIKNEAEHIVDNMVNETVRLTLAKMRKIRRILTL